MADEEIAIPSQQFKSPMVLPKDPRFPNQNQSRACWQNFVDFHRCKSRYGDDYEACKYFQFVYKKLCPPTWVNTWDEQVENGTFVGKLD